MSCFAGTWIFGDVLCQMYAFTCFTLSLVNYFSKMKHFNFFMRFNNIDFSLRLGRHICIPLHHHLQTPNKYTAIRFVHILFLDKFTQFAFIIFERVSIDSASMLLLHNWSYCVRFNLDGDSLLWLVVLYIRTLWHILLL